jgi:hypothetical protein
MIMTELLPPYILKHNARSRHIRVSVSAGGAVKVTAPKRVSSSVINSFLLSKKDWLFSKVEYFKKIPEQKFSAADERRYFVENKQKAKVFAEKKVGEWNKRYNFTFNRISIRNSRSRWGSCSSKGTLCFNYKIVFLPEHLANYLVVHELCHLKERNHGKNFWSLVAETIPDYLLCRKGLREFEMSFKPSVFDV